MTFFGWIPELVVRRALEEDDEEQDKAVQAGEANH